MREEGQNAQYYQTISWIMRTVAKILLVLLLLFGVMQEAICYKGILRKRNVRRNSVMLKNARECRFKDRTTQSCRSRERRFLQVS